MLTLRRVFSFTDFLRNRKAVLAQVAEGRSPVVLTVKGKPSVVLQDADSYQDLLDRLDELQTTFQASDAARR
jgi:prevent-host-death family protein